MDVDLIAKPQTVLVLLKGCLKSLDGTAFMKGRQVKRLDETTPRNWRPVEKSEIVLAFDYGEGELGWSHDLYASEDFEWLGTEKSLMTEPLKFGDTYDPVFHKIGPDKIYSFPERVEKDCQLSALHLRGSTHVPGLPHIRSPNWFYPTARDLDRKGTLYIPVEFMSGPEGACFVEIRTKHNR